VLFLFDLMQEAEDKDGSTKFVNVMQYADPTRVANGEIGSWLGVRFIETNLACLYNCGAIDAQTTVTAAISAGDGAPDPATTAVDQVYYVGESTATHYITVADSSGFAVGDYVTVHVDRTNDFGVTSVTKRGYAKRLNARVKLPSAAVDEVSRRLSAVRATPVIWIGAPGYDESVIYGFYKDWSIDVAHWNVSFCQLTIEGLV
jgi:hypothetical protein